MLCQLKQSTECNMNGDSCELRLRDSRLGDCEVCAAVSAKYTCPKCEVKTCSLPCIKIHKAELDCDGVRNRVLFKRFKSLTGYDVHSDYRLLEETSRVVESAKNIHKLNSNVDLFKNKKNASALIYGARRKEIGLKLLPPSFQKHKENSTRYLRKTNEFLWDIKWIFCQADAEIIDHKISDLQLLSDAVSKYLAPQDGTTSQTRASIAPYHDKKIFEIEILLPAQGIPGTKFFLMNPKETIASNLKYKNIIEHPTFYVILEERLMDYQIVHIRAKSKSLLECQEDDDSDSDADKSVI